MNEHLIATLMSGVTSDPPWQAFVAALRHAFAGNHANVIFRRPDIATPWITQDTGASVAALGDPVDGYVAANDPMRYFHMLAFKAHVLEDFIAPEALASHPFTAGYLWRYGMRSLLICRVQVEDDMQAWLSVTRPGESAFNRQDKDLMEQMARLFGPALALFGRHQDVIDQRDASARVLHARGTGIARLDQHGHLLHLDAGAQRWVDEARLIRSQAHRLVAACAQDKRLFDDAMKAVLSGAQDESLIVLQGDGGTDAVDGLELLLYRVAEPYEPARNQSARVVIYMNMLGRQHMPSPQRLRQLFNLTRRQAALTIVLARGLTVAEAARDLGLSEQTARAYLRQIFEKVGVTRQADLIRRIQGSIASLS